MTTAWEKLVQREGDFLKNCLLYESFRDDFPRTFGRPHPDFLTIRRGDTFTHYLDGPSAQAMAERLARWLHRNPQFAVQLVARGKLRAHALVRLASSLRPRELQRMPTRRLRTLTAEYFRRYRAAYPDFNLTVFADGARHGPADCRRMARLRLHTRRSFEAAHRHVQPLLGEIGRRCRLTVPQVKRLTPREILTLLDGRPLDVARRVRARQRCTFRFRRSKFSLHENQTLRIATPRIVNLVGQCAQPGRHVGRVAIVRAPADVKHLRRGDVLVTPMTTPPIIAAGIRRAGAIVTDEGGVTCHAAVVARELRLPCVIGTKAATAVLANGDLVEVDANQGKVRRLRRPRPVGTARQW